MFALVAKRVILDTRIRQAALLISFSAVLGLRAAIEQAKNETGDEQSESDLAFSKHSEIHLPQDGVWGLSVRTITHK